MDSAGEDGIHLLVLNSNIYAFYEKKDRYGDSDFVSKADGVSI